MKNFTPQSIFSFFVFILFTFSLLANGLEYRVQLTIPIDSVNEADLSLFDPVRKSKTSTEVGCYDNYLLAMRGMYDLEDLGFQRVEIKAYFNQQSISIDDAFTLENNRNELDEKNQNQELISEQKMNEILLSVQNNDFYYTVQIALETEQNINKFFDFPKELDETVTPKGYYRYTFGVFATHQDAKDAMQMLVEYEIEGIQVVAFDDLERIPLSIAQEKEKTLLQESLASN